MSHTIAPAATAYLSYLLTKCCIGRVKEGAALNNLTYSIKIISSHSESDWAQNPSTPVNRIGDVGVYLFFKYLRQSSSLLNFFNHLNQTP
jgi:hypothetical protein